MATSTSSIYINVIEDVINKLRDEFVDKNGPGEDVLKELQGVILDLQSFKFCYSSLLYTMRFSTGTNICFLFFNLF